MVVWIGASANFLMESAHTDNNSEEELHHDCRWCLHQSLLTGILEVLHVLLCSLFGEVVNKGTEVDCVVDSYHLLDPGNE